MLMREEMTWMINERWLKSSTNNKTCDDDSGCNSRTFYCRASALVHSGYAELLLVWLCDVYLCN